MVQKLRFLSNNAILCGFRTRNSVLQAFWLPAKYCKYDIYIPVVSDIYIQVYIKYTNIICINYKYY